CAGKDRWKGLLAGWTRRWPLGLRHLLYYPLPFRRRDHGRGGGSSSSPLTKMWYSADPTTTARSIRYERPIAASTGGGYSSAFRRTVPNRCASMSATRAE